MLFSIKEELESICIQRQVLLILLVEVQRRPRYPGVPSGRFQSSHRMQPRDTNVASNTSKSLEMRG